MKLQIRGRSREQVGFVAACSVRKGGTGLELNYRGNNERTALSDGSNILYFLRSTQNSCLSKELRRCRSRESVIYFNCLLWLRQLGSNQRPIG